MTGPLRNRDHSKDSSKPVLQLHDLVQQFESTMNRNE